MADGGPQPGTRNAEEGEKSCSPVAERMPHKGTASWARKAAIRGTAAKGAGRGPAAPAQGGGAGAAGAAGAATGGSRASPGLKSKPVQQAAGQAAAPKTQERHRPPQGDPPFSCTVRGRLVGATSTLSTGTPSSVCSTAATNAKGVSRSDRAHESAPRRVQVQDSSDVLATVRSETAEHIPSLDSHLATRSRTATAAGASQRPSAARLVTRKRQHGPPVPPSRSDDDCSNTFGNLPAQEALAEYLSAPGDRRSCLQFDFVITTEFTMSRKGRINAPPDRSTNSFVRVLADDHNREVGPQFSRMRTTLRASGEPLRRGTDWSVCGADVSTALSRKVKLVSPSFNTVTSPWRSSIIETWNHLIDHYTLQTDDRCDTTIHIYLGRHLKVEYVQRLAEAIIHFEPAFDVCISDHRALTRGSKKRNWADNPCLARAGKTRADAIELIDAISPSLNWCSFERELDIMQASNERYRWNLAPRTNDGAVCFSQQPGLVSPTSALLSAALIASFVNAAILCPDVDELEDTQPTVQGLHGFLSWGHLVGANKEV